MGHALTENRHGLAVGGGVTIASGTAEREAALDLIDRHRPVESRGGRRRITVGGDKGFDVADFVEELRHRKVTPHIAVQDHVTKTGKRRKTKIDGRTTRHPGYGVSQRCRKRIEEVFGWVKTARSDAIVSSGFRDRLWAARRRGSGAGVASRSRATSMRSDMIVLRLLDSTPAWERSFSSRVTSACKEGAFFAVRRTSFVSSSAAFSLAWHLLSCHFSEPARGH